MPVVSFSTGLSWYLGCTILEGLGEGPHSHYLLHCGVVTDTFDSGLELSLIECSIKIHGRGKAYPYFMLSESGLQKEN